MSFRHQIGSASHLSSPTLPTRADGDGPGESLLDPSERPDPEPVPDRPRYLIAMRGLGYRFDGQGMTEA